VIATTGEEARNPQRSIPISIVLSLLFVFFAYFGVSAVQTLMVPYYLQTEELTKGAPLPYVFDYVGLPVAKWVISIGALTGLSTSLLGAMFPLPRVLYAMASDGVIFRFLSDVHPKFKTPLMATFLSGLLAGGMAAMFDVKELADMMSIGTLLAYTLVAVSVLILRYKDEKMETFPSPGSDNSINPYFVGSSNDSNDNEIFTVNDFLRQCFNLDRLTSPTILSSRVSVVLISLICAILIIFDSLLVALETKLANLDVASLIGVIFVFLIVITTIIALGTQPSSVKKISFQVFFIYIKKYLILQKLIHSSNDKFN
jgi:L-asparagine transporter-like permease